MSIVEDTNSQSMRAFAELSDIMDAPSVVVMCLVFMPRVHGVCKLITELSQITMGITCCACDARGHMSVQKVPLDFK